MLLEEQTPVTMWH